MIEKQEEEGNILVKYVRLLLESQEIGKFMERRRSKMRKEMERVATQEVRVNSKIKELW